MRIQYKGGVWKNSEDEILKAAVMKYGKNQWARIASLLVRKSAKQCKARWFEWLDPSIKKTQWTREEEERLLHLVKIMPTAWRTIAPMIGRTAAQCLEHYETLIDTAQNADAQPAASSSAGGGGIDSVPETKPARPDPVDMDEDELEMLSEARARLANTKGKKAKRKAREKALEAARRLAQLQKRRELKAAGIDMKPSRKNRKVTDYATEIPFERPPVPGFYDTREEDEQAAVQMKEKKQVGKWLQTYKGQSEAEKEEEARKRDTAKRKQLEESNLPAALGLTHQPPHLKSPPLKKARFSLPVPQLSDLQLEKLSELGNPANAQNALPPTTPMQRNGEREIFARRAPLSGISNANGNSVSGGARASAAKPWAAVRQRHLETIMLLKSSQTPLRGGENVPVASLDLHGKATPATADLRTPNPLATPSFMSNGSLVASNAAQMRKDEREKYKKLQDKVRKGLAGLPEPVNEYELDFGDEVDEENDEELIDVEGSMVEDAEEEAIRHRTECVEKLESMKLHLFSSAAKRQLPIPTQVVREDSPCAASFDLVRQDIEVLNLLKDGDGKTEGHDLLMKLETARAKDVVEDVRHAERLVDEQICADGEDGSKMQVDILKMLESREDMESEAASPPRVIEKELVGTGEDADGPGKEQDEKLGCEESENIERLWKKLGKHGEERIYSEAAAAVDDESILTLLDDLRRRVTNVKMPNSLREMHI